MSKKLINQYKKQILVQDLANADLKKIKINVPLFNDGKSDIGMNIEIFPRFDAWSFTIEDDHQFYDTLLYELFQALCRKHGLLRHVTITIEEELKANDSEHDCCFNFCGQKLAGDCFTFEGIFHLLSTAIIPYWYWTAKEISSFDRGKGWNDTLECAINALGKWHDFDKMYYEDAMWNMKYYEKIYEKRGI